MKKLFYLLIPAMFFFACNNAETKKEDEKCCDKTKECNGTSCKDVIKVDSLIANIDSFVGKEVKVGGLCTHVCEHSGKNIFLNSPKNDSIMILGKAGEGIDKFDKNLVGKHVMLIGTLKSVEVENEDVEVHHDITMNYYIEVKEVKECSCGGGCGGEHKEGGCGDKKGSAGCGEHKEGGCGKHKN